MITLLLVSSALLITAYYAILMVNKYITARNIPGRKGLPLVGNAYEMLTKRSAGEFWLYLNSNCDEFSKYGIFKLWACGLLIVGLGDPIHIETFFKSPHSFSKGSIYKLYFGDLFDGLFTTDFEEKWKIGRIEAVKSINNKTLIITKYHKCFVANANVLVSDIRKKCNREDNIHYEIEKCILNNISETFSGTSLKHSKNPHKYMVLENASRALELLEENTFNYYYFWKFGMKMKKQFQRYEQYKKNLFGVIEEVIENKLTNFEKKGQKRQLQLLAIHPPDQVYKTEMEYLKTGRENFVRNSGERSIRRDLSGDTTMNTTRSALAFIAMFPEIQEKVYQEQLSIFGDSSRDPTPEDIESMVYLRMVIKETIRHIAAPILIRICKDAIKIGKYTIPKGTVIFICSHSVHHNPKYWKRPDDFFPEHFSPVNEAERPNFAYIPFGGGPRKCAGYNYGLSMIFILLSAIIRNFHLSTSLKYEDISYKYLLLLQFENNYSIRFVERNKH